MRKLLPELVFLPERPICMARQAFNYQTSTLLIVMEIILLPLEVLRPSLIP